MKYLLAVLFTALIGCSGDIDESLLNIEESTSWTDSHMEAAFEKAVGESGIKYRTVGNQYFYSVGDRAVINEISRGVIEDYSPKGAFFFYREDDLNKAKNKLDAEGITYRTIRKDDGYGIDWDKAHTSKAHEIIHEVNGIPLGHLEQDHEVEEQAEQGNSSEPKYSIIEIKEYEVEKAKSDFDRLVIDYSVFKTKTGFMVRWKNEDTDMVLKVLDTADYYYDPK